MKQWEYKWAGYSWPENNEPALREALLNEFGSQGWELVNVETYQSGFRCIFKREVVK